MIFDFQNGGFFASKEQAYSSTLAYLKDNEKSQSDSSRARFTMLPAKFLDDHTVARNSFYGDSDHRTNEKEKIL